MDSSLLRRFRLPASRRSSVSSRPSSRRVGRAARELEDRQGQRDRDGRRELVDGEEEQVEGGADDGREGGSTQLQAAVAGEDRAEHGGDEEVAEAHQGAAEG